MNKSELCKMVGLAWNTVGHHLRILAKRGSIGVEDRGWDHGVFVAAVPPSHKGWLRALHDEDSASVLLELLRDPPLGVYDLSHRLGHSHKVIRRRINRLVDDGVVEKHGDARPRYRPATPPSDLPLYGADEMEFRRP